jgi:hypothetical protein
MMKTNKWAPMVLVSAGFMVSGCAHDAAMQTMTCGVLVDPPAPSQAAIDNANCPNSTDVYLSAVFKDGRPAGVGGGLDAGTDSKSDKKVTGGENICWVATDESGGSSDQKFDILFSPSDNPNTNQNYQSINIFPHAPKGLEYKYTVWAGGAECEYFDPRFVIN